MPLAFALLLAGLVAPDAAGGLHWNAPPSCPTQAEVAALLDRQSQAGADDRVAGLRTTADATELPDGSWLVEIDIQGGGTRVQRVLQLDSCMAAAEAVALLYSLALTGG